MIECGRQLEKILSADTPYQNIRLRFALQEILLAVCESWPGAALWGRHPPATDFARINRALEMVFENRLFVSTQEAAKACGMNRHAFSALFRSWMNVGFADFSVRHRLHQAAMHLRESTEPVKAIARYYGFADASHFHRLFMKHFGVSAAEYRQQSQGADIR